MQRKDDLDLCSTGRTDFTEGRLLNLHQILKKQAFARQQKDKMVILVKGTHLQYRGPHSSLLFLEDKGKERIYPERGGRGQV